MARPDKPSLAILLVGCVALLAHAAWWGPFVIDDAYISFRYAMNLRGGLGPVYQAGDWVEGFSNPLWMTQLALMGGVFGDLAVARVLGAGSWLLALVLGHFFLGVVAREAGAPSPRLASAAWMAWIVGCPILAPHAMGGLETVQSALLLAVVAATLGVASPGPWAMVSAVAMALFLWSRPEALGYAIVLLVAGNLIPLRWRDTVMHQKWILISFGSIALLTLLRMWLYGAGLPNTVAAKSPPLAEAIPTGLRYLWVNAQPAPMTLALAVCVCLALVSIVYLYRQSPRMATLLTPMLLIIAANVAFVLKVGGDWMPNGRFLASLSMVGGMVGAVCIAALGARPRLRAGLAAAMIAAGIVGAAVGENSWHPATGVRVMKWKWQEETSLSERAASALPGSSAPGGSQALAGLLEGFLLDGIPPGATLLVPDIGLAGYALPDVRIIDSAGLVTPAATWLMVSQYDPAIQAPARGAFQALLDREPPDWAVVYDIGGGRPALLAEYAFYEWAGFAGKYEYIAIQPLPQTPQFSYRLYRRADSAVPTTEQIMLRRARYDVIFGTRNDALR